MEVDRVAPCTACLGHIYPKYACTKSSTGPGNRAFPTYRGSHHEANLLYHFASIMIEP